MVLRARPVTDDLLGQNECALNHRTTVVLYQGKPARCHNLRVGGGNIDNKLTVTQSEDTLGLRASGRKGLDTDPIDVDQGNDDAFRAHARALVNDLIGRGQ